MNEAKPLGSEGLVERLREWAVFAEKQVHVEAGPYTIHGHLREAASRIEELGCALTKIDTIRNSIIGCQKVNWSEHIYPLVAALGEAGFEGQPYEDARANVGTLIAQRDAAEASIQSLQRQLEEAREALRPFARVWRDLPERLPGDLMLGVVGSFLEGPYSIALVSDFRLAASTLGRVEGSGSSNAISGPTPKSADTEAEPSGPVNCQHVLRREGKAYPRTCERCRLGPCPFYNNDGSAKR